jgi:hypothetical protein
VPVIEGAAELLAAGFFPGGSERNLKAVAPFVDGDDRRPRGCWRMPRPRADCSSPPDPSGLTPPSAAEAVSGWSIGVV